MAIDIPSGLSTDKRARQTIRSDWLKEIFNDLRKVGADVWRVNSRLNWSNTEEAIPVWAGTYEDDELENEQGFKANDVRFGRSNRSKAYEKAVTDKAGQIQEKDWTEGFSEKERDGYGPAQALGPRAGCMYQLYIAIRIKEDKHFKHVGTITVGFRKKPDRKKVDPIMKRWAKEDEGSDYVKYLRKTFNLGGPVC